MPKGLPQNLGTWMAQVERKLDNLASGNRLDHASLDGTTLYLKGDGELGRIGRQPDGSNGVHIAKVQPPPQLTAPILTVGEQAGTCLVEWDGNTFDGRRMPLIHGHTEIWAELVDEDWSPTVAPSDTAKRVGTIRDRTGGEVVVALPQAGTWAVWLRAMGADRETAGPWSPVAQVEISPLVDTDAIEAELEEARDRLDQAEHDLEQGMSERKAEIDYLRDERIPALQDALDTGLDDVYRDAQAYAEAQADDAVNRAAADAQTEYDRLQELAEKALSRAGDNVLEDPSFETNYWFDQWSGSYGDRAFAVSNVARTGAQAMEITGTGIWNITIDTVDVEPGDSWRLALWYRTEGSPTMGDTRLRFRDGATLATLEETPQVEQVGEYTRATLVCTIPEEGVDQLNAVLRVAHTGGTLLVDDMSLREVGAAAEALRLAEVARQEAEAAHIAAGEAVDQAASAWDRAGTQGSILGGLTSPVGVAPEYSYWIQWDSYGEDREPIAVWKREDGSWVSQPLDPEFYPLVDIGAATIGDLHGDRLTAKTVRAGALAIMPDSQDFAPDLVNHADMWTLGDDVSVAASISAENGLALRITGDASSVSGRAYGPWIPAKAGDTIRYRFNVGWYTRLPDGVLRVYFLFDGSLTSGWVRVEQVTSTGIYEGVFTVPTGVTESVAFGVKIDESATNGGDWAVRDFDVRKQVRGVLIEPQGIKSPQVDTEEFFSAVAVIEKVWTNIVRAKMIETQGFITEDMIATGAVTTPKLTVTEEMVGEVARLLRIEAGSLASNDITAMRIVSSLIEATTYLIHNADGDVSVRLDGMDNYLAGRLHAGMTESEGIVLDWGQKVRYSGLTEEGDPAPDRTIRTPYLNFHTDEVNYQSGREPSIHLDRGGTAGFNGMMIINPGYPVGTDAFRGMLNIVGDVRSNRSEAREWSIARHGFSMPNNDPNLNATISQESSTGNTYLLGRHHGASQSRARDSFWVSDQYELEAGALRRRAFTWGAPPPTGQRSPILSVRLTQAASDRNAYVVANSSHHSATGYFINEHNPSNARATYYVYQLAVWEAA